jgi:hypothetical protein
MSAAVMMPVMFPGDRLLVWLGFLLASTIIVAETSTQLDLPLMYDEVITEKIYDDAGGWRETKPIEKDWRAPPPKKEKQGRIKLGFDAETSYRQMGDLPRNDYRAPQQSGLNERKPTNTIFRMEF